MEINNQLTYKQNFGMKYKPRVVKQIMEQTNIPLLTRTKTVQNLQHIATDRFKLISINFFTRREPITHRHINCMELIVLAKEHALTRAKEKFKINFSNGDDRKNLLNYLQISLQTIERNRINQRLQKALNISTQKFKKAQKFLCKIYPDKKEYIESCTPEQFLLY